MRFLVFVIVLSYILFAGCQLIEVPEAKQTSRIKAGEESQQSAESYRKDAEERTPAIDTAKLLSFDLPKQGFDESAVLLLKKRVPFTDFGLQDYKNPFFTVAVFLRALKNRDFELLIPAMTSDNLIVESEIHSASAMFWNVILGRIGLFAGVKKLNLIKGADGELVFELRTISKTGVFTRLILRANFELEKWLVYNYVHVLPLKSADASEDFSQNFVRVWAGEFAPASIEKWQTKYAQPNSPIGELFAKMLLSAKTIDNPEDLHLLSLKQRQKEVPASWLKQGDIYNNIVERNMFILKFYAAKNLVGFCEINSYPVSANLTVTLTLAEFDTSINKYLLLRWFVVRGAALLETARVYTPFAMHFTFLPAKSKKTEINK